MRKAEHKLLMKNINYLGYYRILLKKNINYQGYYRILLKKNINYPGYYRILLKKSINYSGYYRVLLGDSIICLRFNSDIVSNNYIMNKQIWSAKNSVYSDLY